VSRLRNSLGITHPASGLTELTSADADYRAMIDVQRFDPGEAAIFEAVWMVRRIKDGRSERGCTTIRQRRLRDWSLGRWRFTREVQVNPERQHRTEDLFKRRTRTETTES